MLQHSRCVAQLEGPRIAKEAYKQRVSPHATDHRCWACLPENSNDFKTQPALSESMTEIDKKKDLFSRTRMPEMYLRGSVAESPFPRCGAQISWPHVLEFIMVGVTQWH